MGLIGELKLRGFVAGERDLEPLKDEVRMGLRLLAAGKLSPIPEIVRAGKPQPGAEVKASPNRVGYFPGCSLHATGVEYNLSTHRVAGASGWSWSSPRAGSAAAPPRRTPPTTSWRRGCPSTTSGLVAQGGDAEATLPCAACYLALPDRGLRLSSRTLRCASR